MDDDPVLRELGADLERDDPRLAALLSGAGEDTGHRHRWLLLLLTPPALMALFLVNQAVFGAATLLLILAAPVIVCWLLPPPSGTPTPGPG